jgi:hypothetical protein
LLSNGMYEISQILIIYVNKRWQGIHVRTVQSNCHRYFLIKYLLGHIKDKSALSFKWCNSVFALMSNWPLFALLK